MEQRGPALRRRAPDGGCRLAGACPGRDDGWRCVWTLHPLTGMDLLLPGDDRLRDPYLPRPRPRVRRAAIQRSGSPVRGLSPVAAAPGRRLSSRRGTGEHEAALGFQYCASPVWPGGVARIRRGSAGARGSGTSRELACIRSRYRRWLVPSRVRGRSCHVHRLRLMLPCRVR